MSTETGVPRFETGAIGAWGDPIAFAITRERIRAYAAATNDAIAPHAAGDLAPPVFAIVPAFGALGAAAFSVIPGELIGAVVHGEHDLHLHRPLRPGLEVTTRAAPIGVRQRSSGVAVVSKAQTRDGDGELLVEQYMTTFVRGARGAEDAGEEAPPHRFDEALRERDPVAEASQTFDSDQTYRYAEASGDPMQIHLDEEFARSVGLPGIIIHGMCTMAFTSQVLIGHACPQDPTRLRRLAVRFASIVRPQETITTRIWDAGERDGAAAYAYETSSSSGAVVIRDGLGEVAA